MCVKCYGDPERQEIVSDETIRVAGLIDVVYEYSKVGGNAHIVIDDHNLETDHIDWCLTDALKSNSHQASDAQLEAERACLEALKALTLDERVSAIAIHEGCIRP